MLWGPTHACLRAVHRRTLYSLCNMFLPIFSVAVLAFLIIFINPREIRVRLELIFALFLALAGKSNIIRVIATCHGYAQPSHDASPPEIDLARYNCTTCHAAIQLVVGQNQTSRNDYWSNLQAGVNLTVMYLMGVAFVSILANAIVMFPEHTMLTRKVREFQIASSCISFEFDLACRKRKPLALSSSNGCWYIYIVLFDFKTRVLYMTKFIALFSFIRYIKQ